jgi:SAM-dependent methyltransferase
MSIRWRWLVVAFVAALVAGPMFQAVGQDKDLKYNTIYVPTDEKVIEKMFDMAKVTKDDVVFDLGCGDGRIVAMAAKKFGCRGVGVDIEPERVLLWPDTIKKYDVKSFVYKGMIEYRLGDALKVPDLDKATVVMLYMLPEFMNQLKPIAQKTLKPGARIVSHDFRWEGNDWEPEVVRFENKTLYLWTVKAKKAE